MSRREASKDYTCPACGAAVAEPCKGKGGRERLSVHRERLNAIEVEPKAKVDRAGKRLGTIYFIGCEAQGTVKIGFTAGNPHARLHQLKTGSSHPLKVLACMAGSMGDEASLHTYFRALRLHGEWFKNEGDLAAYIKVVAK